MDKPIEVCQFVLPGNENHGKWYVCRGSGKHASYLCEDGNWYSDTLRGGFFWETKSEANAAAQPHRHQEGPC